MAILLGHLFSNVIVVDTPYKHFACITASHNQAIMVQGQSVELLVSDSGSEIVWRELYRKQRQSFIDRFFITLVVSRTFPYFKLISF